MIWADHYGYFLLPCLTKPPQQPPLIEFVMQTRSSFDDFLLLLFCCEKMLVWLPWQPQKLLLGGITNRDLPVFKNNCRILMDCWPDCWRRCSWNNYWWIINQIKLLSSFGGGQLHSRCWLELKLWGCGDLLLLEFLLLFKLHQPFLCQSYLFFKTKRVSNIANKSTTSAYYVWTWCKSIWHQFCSFDSSINPLINGSPIKALRLEWNSHQFQLFGCISVWKLLLASLSARLSRWR